MMKVVFTIQKEVCIDLNHWSIHGGIMDNSKLTKSKLTGIDVHNDRMAFRLMRMVLIVTIFAPLQPILAQSSERLPQSVEQNSQHFIVDHAQTQDSSCSLSTCLDRPDFTSPYDPAICNRFPWSVELEYQRYRAEKNLAQRPNTSLGTRFDVNEFTGDTGNNLRLTGFVPLNWWKPGDAFRLVIAPFSQSGTAIPTAPIKYDGATFQSGVPLTVDYKFNTYRLTYLVPIFTDANDAGWDFRIGATLAIRDAQIKLSQGSLVQDFPNVGPVPLLYLSATKNLGRDWRVLGECDAFPAPGGGGLFDGSLKVGVDLLNNVELNAGVRYQIGAAIDPEIYNSLSAWAFVVGVRARF
jgi:hypothetical protein